jgi:uroporphyrinogen decarboxylase
MPIKWEPAIYEHKAALIGKSPAEVANSAKLLTEAVLKEYEVYQADYVTVGLDVYNIEAETLGAKLTAPGENECPDLAGRLYDLNNLPEYLTLPDIPGAGRFSLLIETGKNVKDAIGGKTKVRVAASGPVTLAAKLAGIEDLIMSLCMQDGNAMRLLEFTAQIAAEWCSCLRRNGLEVIIFDSMVAPPMFSPDMYAEFALPLHQKLMGLLEKSGQLERELVIGGNTAQIAGLLKQTGANFLLCDYAADAAAFKSGIGDDSNLKIRRNINPALLNNSNMEELADKFDSELNLFSNPVAGTGILPFDFTPDSYLDFKELIIRRRNHRKNSCYNFP